MGNVDEERVRRWASDYRRGAFTAAFESGGTLSGTGGRPKKKRRRDVGGKAPVRDERLAKERRKEATREDDVEIGPDGAGGIAARMRGRAQAGQR